ncbi:PQQ-dependent sugar dehydrogenase [Streptomyces durhamensis]|uniref:PQQ-dependent sugar dehydrogenase n=1 Tax=Streptomyces durhamensis TaxID=68194 RepID=UPI00099DB6A3|nr:PQQ-dependent sugar dehydrogenase [Streptomyces durhamensis]
MSLLTHAARRVRPVTAALTTATALLIACVVQTSPATAATAAATTTASRPTGSQADARADGGAPSGISTLSDKWNRPWAITFLPNGMFALVTERFTSTVHLLGRDGSKKMVGTVPNTVVPDVDPTKGSGGLLGVAPSPTWNGTTDKDVFFVHTAAEGTRIVRMKFDGKTLTGYTVLVGGIKRGADHNGGKIAFGPDGYLYVATGDAQTGSLAQNKNSLNGKILRITKTGAAAPGNPFGNRVYSLGHRNPQGFAWDTRGRLWASEIGEAKWDELNLIKAGANYGWPLCEGTCATAGMTNPKFVWKPEDGGVPAQVAIVNNVVYVTTLRGERLWRLPIDGTGQGIGAAKSYYVNAYARLRALTKVPDTNQLLMGTSDRGTDRDFVLKVTIK